jgi:hypothetical protein
MLAKFVVAMALSQIDDKQYWLKVDTDQCQTIYDGSHPQMNRISFLGRKLTHGTKSIETAYENGIGVVRILSRPVNASTSWLRAVKRLSKQQALRWSKTGCKADNILAVGTSATPLACKAAT